MEKAYWNWVETMPLLLWRMADIELAVKSIFFAAVGTTGQRCTSVRRLFLHEKVYDTVVEKLIAKYSSLRIDDPFAEGVECGPMASKEGVRAFANAIQDATQILKGGVLLQGEKF